MHYNTVIIGIVIVVVALIASRILCVYIRKPMVEFCNSRGFSASPWITLLMVCFGAQKLLDHFKRIELDEILRLSDNIIYKESTSGAINFYGSIFIMALPLIVLLIRTRKYFPVVLLIKTLCVPLDLIYIVNCIIRGGRFADATPISRDEYRSGRQHAQASRGQGSYVNGDSPDESDYVEEKYRDQYRASQEADSYHTASSDDGDRYYTGDYVPFVSEGEVTEVRTYDSDYAPMDES